MRTMVDRIRTDVESGSSLYEALSAHPVQFDELYTNLVKAGEAAGVLDTILDEIASYKERIESIKGKIKKALYYPIAVLPGWMQVLSRLIPVTYALEAMRLALLQGASFGELLPDILALAVFGVVFLPASLVAFRYAVGRARVDGSLTHY